MPERPKFVPPTEESEVIKIPIYGRGYIKHYALIDREDFELVNRYRWFSSKKHQERKTPQKEDYIIWAHNIDEKTGKQNNKWLMLSRLIMKAKFGEIVDHINRDNLDNRKCNLRICTIKQNNQNSSLKITNTSGFKGVTFFRNKKTKQWYWKATVAKKDGKDISTYHKDKKEAALSYDKMAVEYYGEFACTNKNLGLL